MSSLPPVINLDETLAYIQFIEPGPRNWLGRQQSETVTRALRSANNFYTTTKLQKDRSYDLLYERDIIPFQQDAPLQEVGQYSRLLCSGAHTQFTPGLRFLYVHLRCLVQNHVHKLVKALVRSVVSGRARKKREKREIADLGTPKLATQKLSQKKKEKCGPSSVMTHV